MTLLVVNACLSTRAVKPDTLLASFYGSDLTSCITLKVNKESRKRKPEEQKNAGTEKKAKKEKKSKRDGEDSSKKVQYFY